MFLLTQIGITIWTTINAQNILIGTNEHGRNSKAQLHESISQFKPNRNTRLIITEEINNKEP
jgi:hypothetical protein